MENMITQQGKENGFDDFRNDFIEVKGPDLEEFIYNLWPTLTLHLMIFQKKILRRIHSRMIFWRP